MKKYLRLSHSIINDILSAIQRRSLYLTVPINNKKIYSELSFIGLVKAFLDIIGSNFLWLIDFPSIIQRWGLMVWFLLFNHWSQVFSNWKILPRNYNWIMWSSGHVHNVKHVFSTRINSRPVSKTLSNYDRVEYKMYKWVPILKNGLPGRW